MFISLKTSKNFSSEYEPFSSIGTCFNITSIFLTFSLFSSEKIAITWITFSSKSSFLNLTENSTPGNTFSIELFSFSDCFNALYISYENAS